MNANTKKISYAAVVISLVFLFLPNILIIDLLPDFIACFLLASIFRKGEDGVSYFSEAKVSLLRLGYWNLLKLVGIALIILVRSGNVSDYDILALVSTVFAAGELILSIGAVKNVFAALFYFGERSDASALIRGKAGDAEPVRSLSYLFVVVKCLGYSVPQFFALSKVNENGTVSVVRDSYPAMLLIFFLLALAVGIAWFVRLLGYVKGIRQEGVFAKELARLESEQPPEVLDEKCERRSFSRVYLFGTLSCFTLFSLRFANLSEINLLPHPLHAFLLLLFTLSLLKAAKNKDPLTKSTVGCGVGYLATSLFAFIAECIFYTTFKYPEEGISEKEFLYEMANGKAGRFFRVYEASATLELLFCILYVILLCLVLLRFIPERLGGKKTPANDFTDNIRRLRIKALVFTASLLLSVCANYGAVLLEGSVHMEEILQGDGTTISIITTQLPWYGSVTFAVALLACALGCSFFRSMKEETIDPQN